MTPIDKASQGAARQRVLRKGRRVNINEFYSALRRVAYRCDPRNPYMTTMRLAGGEPVAWKSPGWRLECESDRKVWRYLLDESVYTLSETHFPISRDTAEDIACL